jgi:hypothetical protein
MLSVACGTRFSTAAMASDFPKFVHVGHPVDPSRRP